MFDGNHTIKAGVLSAAAAAGRDPGDPVSAGVATAAEVLGEHAGLDLSKTEDLRRFARAVHDVVQHRDPGGLDFSEDSRDVARMVLAVWSLDMMRSKAGGMDVPENHDRFVRDVTSGMGDLRIREGDPSLLDEHAYGMARDAVLAAASVPSSLQPDVRAWEEAHVGRPDDAARGFAPIGPGLLLSKGEMDDCVLEAFVDALNARVGARVAPESARNAVFRSGLGHEGLLAASDARRPFPDDLSAPQKGMLAAEEWMSRGLGRPLRDYEHRMFDAALGRVLGAEAVRPLDDRTAARMVLLDASIQMNARATVDDGSFGRRAMRDRMAFDSPIDASAGMEVSSWGISPSEDTSRAVAAGRFAEIPDPAIAESIADGLSDARRPYSKEIDRELGMILQVQAATRGRDMAVAERGEDAVRRPEAMLKGPTVSEVPAFGRHLSSGIGIG